MASTDTELIAEVRQFTDYDSTIISDSDMQELVDIGKEELRAEFDNPSFSFYQTGEENTLQADRALFWFVCIGTKIKSGEFGGMNLEVSEIVATTPDSIDYAVWFKNFRKRLDAAQTKHSAAGGGPASTTTTRDNRSYGDSYDTSVREPEG